MKHHYTWLAELSLPEKQEQELVEFIEFLGVERHFLPKGLMGVCEGFERCLCLTNNGFEGFPTGLLKYISVVKYLLAPERRKTVEARHPELAANRIISAGSHLHGFLSGDSAPYSALFFIHPINPHALVRLQQCMLLALWSLRYGATKLKPNHIEQFCVGIRASCGKEYEGWLAEQNSDELASPQAILDILPNCGDTSVSSLYLKFHVVLDLLVGNSVHLRNGISRTGGGYRRGWKVHGVSALGFNIYVEPQTVGDEDDDTEHPTIYSLQQPGVQIENELHDLGVENNELKGPFEFIFHADQGLLPSAQAFKDKLKAQGAIKRIERENQCLPLSTSRLNEADMRSVIYLIKKLRQTNNELPALALLATLLTGSSVDKIKRFVIFPRDAPLGFSGEQALGFSLLHHSWVIKAYSPPFESSIRDELNDCCRISSGGYLLLPEPKGTILSKLIDSCVARNNFKPFQKKTKYVLSGLSGWSKDSDGDLTKVLKRLLKLTGTRVTLTRLERCLPNHVAEISESTVATYMFNSYMPASSARSFYTTLKPNFYQMTYIRARRWLVKQAASEQQLVFGVEKLALGQTFGGRYCPATEHVREVVEGLIEQLNKYRSRLLAEEKSWITFHNYFTATCIYLQGFFTGIRSVRDPFLGIDAILVNYGIATFQDKDNAEQAHTRTIPVHQLLIRLASEYRAHRQAVLSRLVLLNMKQVIPLLLPDAPETFLLTDSGKIIETKPSTLAPILDPNTSLPLNSNRKFLRTELMERGVSSSAVDLLLGHANRGEAVGHGLSTECFETYAMEVLEGLDLLLCEVGVIKASSQLKGLSV